MSAFKERRTVTGIAFRWIHLAIGIAVYLLTIGAMYGSMHTQVESTARDLRELKEQSARRDQQLQEFREEMRRRLDRLEWKVGEKTLRELQ
jgi:membrane protein required for beta-lactamase induction